MRLHPKLPLLVFGGPYSNLRALQAMRAKADALGIGASQTICTGDVVAYCAEPEETVALIRAWGCHVVSGNCEEQLAADADDCGCGFDDGTACDRLSKDWYAFARARVSAASRRWMAGLPAHLEFKLGDLSVRVIHGGVRQTNRFVFASERTTLAEEIDAAGAGIVISGHAGVPFIERAGERVWFNPGVIGMPANDGTADGWYGIVEADAGGLKLSTHRLVYDATGAARALLATGHSAAYAAALTSGLWPSTDVLPPAEKAATGLAIARSVMHVAADKVAAARLAATAD